MSADRPIRVLLVDDEPLARRGLLRLLADDARVEVVGECPSGRAAVEALERGGVDLVFLDVEMPGMSGFDVVEAIGPNTMPPVVFVTAFDRYAVKAFEANAVDYVLKPVDPVRFTEALERALQAMATRSAASVEGRLEQLLGRMEAREKYARRLVVREAGRVHFVPVEELDWLEAAGNYVRLHVDGRILLQRESLSNLEQRLDPEQFVRIHRSTIVRLDRVREVRPIAHGDCSLALADGTQLAASRRYRAALDEHLSSDS